MRAHCIVRHGEPLEALDRPIPEPVGTEVLVRVTAAGLCHTDLHIWEGSYDLGGGKRLTLAHARRNGLLRLRLNLRGRLPKRLIRLRQCAI